MNFTNLLEQLWTMSGYPDPTTNRQDWRLQQYKDAINATFDEIVATNAPRLFALQREATFTLVPGTAVYTLDDYVARILSMYTTDIAAHKLTYVRPRRADQEGFRNPAWVSQPLGPYAFTDAMRSGTALYSGPSGVMGATVAEGGTSVSLGSSGTALPTDSTLVGRMIRFNGEAADYQILSVGGAHALTIDKPVVSRVTGVGSTGVGTGYTNVSWQISPPGRMRIQILPTPTDAKTVSYRYAKLPRRLVGADDQPEIQEEFHHLIWKGALAKVAASKQNPEAYQMWMGEFAKAIADFRNADDDEFDSTDAPKREMLHDLVPAGTPLGTYSRYGFSGGVMQ